MAARRPSGRITQLWQLPLFIVSLGLFGYAAFLLLNPGPGATLDQKIEVARSYLKQDRPDSACQQLNRLLEIDKLPKDKEASIHLLLAEALAAAQAQLKIDIPANHQRIIEQTEMAMEMGIKADSVAHRRLADSYAALGQTSNAVTHYRQAIILDPSHSLRIRRKMIELQLGDDDTVGAEMALDEYLKCPDLSDVEHAWALDQRAGILIGEKKFADARSLLAEAAKLDADPVDQGQFNYQLGYCAYSEGQLDDAERFLRLSRDQLRVKHPMDAEASLLLGRIYQEKNDPVTAISFFEVVLTSHPDSKVSPLALLGRGVCRIMSNQSDAGLTDLQDVTAQIDRRSSRSRYKPDVIDGLRGAVQILADRQEYQGALEVLTDEQKLNPVPETGFYARLARVYDKRADQLDASIADAVPADKIRRGQQVRDFRTKAGDAYIAYSRALTLADDKGYADALWKGIDLYDQAGNLQNVISSLELFVAERPEDRLAPDALLRLGRAYQAAGLFDKAIEAYQRNQFRYPKTLAASKSAVPLAQAYVAKGPEQYAKAEKTLLSVVEDNPLIDPNAEEFRQALYELAQLYYRTGRYEEGIARYHELTERYPNDEQKPQLIFLMADSYRKSAGLLEGKIAAGSQATRPSADVAEEVAAMRDRLGKARELYDQTIDLYRTAKPASENDKLYQKLAFFYRADCAYDLGNYDEAIKLYDQAAFGYQNDPSALAAYVQIVNAYCALGKPEEAKAANNRAKWMLKHMPADAFTDGGFSMPKKYWDQWLSWTNDSGMW